MAYSEQAYYAKAIADYNQTLRLNPEDADAYDSRGYAREQQGDLAGAIADYAAALRLDPHNEYATENLARAQQQKINEQ